MAVEDIPARARLTTHFTRPTLELVTVGSLACAGAVVAYLPSAGYGLRLLLEIPLVLILPGYAIAAAALPRRDRWTVEWFAVAFGASMSAVALCGLALDQTHWGLQRRPWATVLAGLTVAGVLVALLRDGPSEKSRGPSSLRIEPGLVIVLTIVLLVAVGAAGVARLDALQAKRNERFTQLWMLPARGGTAVRIGVVNDEGKTQRYTVVLRAGLRPLATWHDVVLAANRSRVVMARLPRGLPDPSRLEADLYRGADSRVVYRHVTYSTGRTRSG